MKKLLALLLAGLMIFSFAACSNDDKENDKNLESYVQEDEDDITFVTNDKGQTFHFELIDSESVKLTKYEGPSNPHALEIPDTLNNKTLVEIGAEAFYHCSALKSVTIPATVTKIGAFAFAGCSSIMTIVLPASVASVGEGAFVDCTALESVTFAASSSLTDIEQYTFRGCTALKWVTVPAYVDTVGTGAFFGCTSLAVVNVKDGVQVIGAQAFMNCDALATLKLPASVVSIGDKAFYGSEKLYMNGVTCPEGSYASERIQDKDLGIAESAPAN